MMLKRMLLAAVVVGLAVSLTGCSDSVETGESEPPSSGPVEDVVYASGELPETIPDEFPLPEGSVIGSTMVITDTGFTEVIVRMSAEKDLAVSFFDQELPKAGFIVDSSADDGGSWLIEYSLDGATHFLTARVRHDTECTVL